MASPVRIHVNPRFPALTPSSHNNNNQGDLGGLQKYSRLGYSLDVRDYKGRTAMHVAASAGMTQVVRYLLKKGAALDLVDDMGRTPMVGWGGGDGELLHQSCLQPRRSPPPSSPFPQENARLFKHEKIVQMLIDGARSRRAQKHWGKVREYVFRRKTHSGVRFRGVIATRSKKRL